ncbi:DUF1697 domain-containing protein [Homoserinibacter sp. YIM 151385]|uniref:DUF1697 domain-containing protein n=1 Tax=Homoserinibacter sp. YIM 151385 TaxID=2985506 RepID=UPI0022F03A80|nr:DUF1697 domain-containing protein [Homoserinibacter sp. YIM 151385]WBU39023.1 DUF1697 domain-containing protein [Homoserinibacter sp. YIM 151385]
MTRFAVLLRGVNVGGVAMKMADLADVLRSRGYGDVRTVLASGNVLLDADADADAVKVDIERALGERFGYEAWVHVLELDRLRELVESYPFERGRDGHHDYAVVVVDEATRAELLALLPELDPTLERAVAGDGVIYWTVEKGRTLDSLLGAAQGRAKYKRWLTTRNLNTLDRLLG